MQFSQHAFIKWATPAKFTQIKGTVLDLPRSKPELIVENALLRQQLLVLNKQVKQPYFKPIDRFLMVELGSWFTSWGQALLIVKSDPLIRWYHQGFRLFRKIKRR